MSEEGGNNGEQLVDELKPNEKGEHPEQVSWSQYVKTKETIGGKLDAERKKVESLEEQLKTAVKQDDFNAIKTELEKTKTDYQKTLDELKGVKEKGVTEKKGILKEKGGFTEEQLNEMSEDAINGAVMMLERNKPKLDLGTGGGGGSELKGSPRELTLQAYTKQ